MGEIKLYNGDCVENMKKIKDGSVHLIITDPPYNLGNFMISRDTNLKKMRENFFASAIDGSYSFASKTSKPAFSKPRDNPPTPANRSITVGFI